MKVLYLTYDGLSDPLGQSQVMPYMMELADKGFDITIVSFEKKIAPEARVSIRKKLDKKKIKWVALRYSKRPPVFSTLFDIFRLKQQCIQLQKKNKYQVVHCRSYITSFAGIMLKKRFGLKFIFDMRGFYADERVEGGLWDQNKFIYRKIYTYFKQKEKDFFNAADSIVTLTEAARKVICADFSLPGSKVNVIPCCVDTRLFDPGKIDRSLQHALKKKILITDNDFVLSYLGTLGTWYLLDEMLDFYKHLSVKYPGAKFLFITYHPPREIIDSAIRKNIAKEKIVVVKALRSEVPLLLSLSHLSIFFIKPTFSKIASSPTKQAELLAMGIPLICNTRVGDIEEIIHKTKAGVLIDKFTNEEYDRVINEIPYILKKDKNEIRKYAFELFSLEKGVHAFEGIYRQLEKANKTPDYFFPESTK